MPTILISFYEITLHAPKYKNQKNINIIQVNIIYVHL